MKTKKMWDRSKLGFLKFCTPGDQIDEEIYDYFLGVVSPIRNAAKFFMMGEAYSINDRGEKTYMVFSNKKPVGKPQQFFFFGIYSVEDITKYM